MIRDDGIFECSRGSLDNFKYFLTLLYLNQIIKSLLSAVFVFVLLCNHAHMNEIKGQTLFKLNT